MMAPESNNDNEEYNEVPPEEHPPERKARPPVLGHPNDPDQPLPPRREHKHTTANLQPERPWKRWLLICLAFLVVIAIMVLLSVFLAKLFNPPEDQDWNKDTAGNGTGAEGGEVSGASKLLPKTGEFLNDVCAEDKLASSSEQCADACAPALSCCNPFANGNSTCFEEEVAGCVPYAVCHVLDGFNEAPHNELDRICSKEEVGINTQACEFACQSMKCCYTDVDSCVATSFQACLDYAPCQNLKTVRDSNNTFMAAAPATLEEDCRDGKAQCLRYCKDGAACSEPQSTFYRDNFVACLTYAPCNNHEDASITRIKVAPIYSVVTEAPANLNKVCLQSNVDTAGPAECQQACAPSECCFADGSANCFGEDPLGCMAYRKCSVLA